MPRKKLKRPKAKPEIVVPPSHDWRTTDEDEVNRRRQRAREESFAITNRDSAHRIFSNHLVRSGSGLTYEVEIRDVEARRFACTCVDFRANGLGTCKHVEAVLLHLQRRFSGLLKAARKNGPDRVDIELDRATDTLCLRLNGGTAPATVRRIFNDAGLLTGVSPEEAMEQIEADRNRGAALRVSQEIGPWLENRRRIGERRRLRHEYELKVQSGEWPAQETSVPLFPYQREGMLHLAFTERALLADEMGLGKTIQAIAACALLHRLGQARRVLVVTPASLKSEWEEQIQKFTGLPYQVVFGPRRQRLKDYADPPFFTIVNYEQMLADSLDVNERLRPDIVVLDEAQRIKNWNTKTAQAVKRLCSRYAFVLTGTPIENRIDELQSLMDFLNPEVLGPLFRFNREYYTLDDRGRPMGYRNLDKLHERVAPVMIRRRKSDVETELPGRTDRNHLVEMNPAQWDAYADHKFTADRLLAEARRRPLRKREMEILQLKLAQMRMTCDTNFILDREDRTSPKLPELEQVFEDCRENDAKIIVFSEWERMLQLVRDLCRRLKLGHAWHTGSVPQRKRRGEINAFKTDPDCRVFLSTDSGSTGLNLQVASVVVNCDLPWNPAKLEQRIARAWRKHQSRPVTVINLIARGTIEHQMLDTLANKQALADGVLDRLGDLSKIQLRSGRQAFLNRLEQLMSPTDAARAKPTRPPPPPADRALAFGQRIHELLGGALVSCEERYPLEGAHTVLLTVVDGQPAEYQGRATALHQELFGSTGADRNEPVRLELIDRATAEALKRLEAAGLIAPTVRSSRPLFPSPATGVEQPLSDDEQAQARSYLEQTRRKLKMAKLLGDGGLDDEVRTPLLQAIGFLAKARAIERRFPEPADVDDAIRPPVSNCFGDALQLVRGYVDASDPAWKPVWSAIHNAAGISG